MFTDIGFEWGLQKCAAIEVNREKLTEGGNLTVSKEESIQIMSKDDHYKFLGMVENSKQLDELIRQTLSQEYICRLLVIWTSNISIPRKIRAMNTFAIPPLQYSFWTCTWTLEKLKQLDRKTREVIKKKQWMKQEIFCCYDIPELRSRWIQSIQTWNGVQTIEDKNCSSHCYIN